MKRAFSSLLVAVIAIISFHCQKEVNESIPRPTIGNSGSAPITATLQGNIFDETGQPAAGATVRVGTKTEITDPKGFFLIRNAALDKNTSIVTIEKAGYFTTYRSFRATSGANHVVVKLTKKNLAATVPISGGEASLVNGAKVILPANAVVKASGGSYSGDIKVFASYIDPTAQDIGQTVPGSFMADDANNNRVTLQSYGMMAVELETTSGEKLQIASGKTATLTMPIPSSIQSSAPQTISLWYIDERTGVWKEEGTATRNGSNYVGQVQHFSFWNCDVALQVITLSITLKNNEGIPLAHAPVRISRMGPYPSQVNSYTDSMGQVSGFVPANENLLLEISDPCNVPIYSQNIGPFQQNSNLPINISTSGNSSYLTITGQVISCGGTPVSNGSAIINYDNSSWTVSTNSSGMFTLVFPRCNFTPTFNITAVDNTSQQQSTATVVPITTPLTNTGAITACGTSALQYINYTLNGTNYSITSASSPDSLYGFTGSSNNPQRTTLMAFSSVTADNIGLNFVSPATAGTYPLSELFVQQFNNTGIITPFNITVTNFPASSGGFYEGNFSGQFRDSANLAPLHTISGSFRIRRL